MAQDPDLHVSMGIEFIYLNQAFETLFKLCTREICPHLPSYLECALAIEKELMDVIYHFKKMDEEEKHDWEPLIQYLKLNPHRLESKLRLSRKIERRLVGLSQQLARLFQDYGRFAPQMVAKWELSNFSGWQPRLWRRLFEEKMGWTYPSRMLKQDKVPSSPFTVHFFSISFLTACEFSFINRLSNHNPVYYYLLSPCAVFWSDIRSDRENAYLQKYWQKKFGAFSPKVLMLEELLRDRNPLLANFGRIGREMACQIEESQASTHAQYVLPHHAAALNEELLVCDDLYLEETHSPLSLLHAIQADLLIMRNPQGLPPLQLEESQSIKLHVAPSRRREVQILYHNLLGLMVKNPSLCPGDIIVMAPQIGDYVPYIHSVFGVDNSQLDFQVLDLGLQTASEIVLGFLQLLELSDGRWNASQLLQLFEHPSFQRRHQLTPGDYSMFQEWVEQAGIRWGENCLHRNELLQRSHCEQGMVEETIVGTWDYGLSRLLLGLTMVMNGPTSTSLEIPPCTMVDFSQADLLGRWIRLLYSLRDDLTPLQDQTRIDNG